MKACIPESRVEAADLPPKGSVNVCLDFLKYKNVRVSQSAFVLYGVLYILYKYILYNTNVVQAGMGFIRF